MSLKPTEFDHWYPYTSMGTGACSRETSRQHGTIRADLKRLVCALPRRVSAGYHRSQMHLSKEGVLGLSLRVDAHLP